MVAPAVEARITQVRHRAQEQRDKVTMVRLAQIHLTTLEVEVEVQTLLAQRLLTLALEASEVPGFRLV